MRSLLQLALDFWGEPDQAAPSSAPAAAPPANATPALPMSEVFQPGTWHHPRGNRRLKLGHCEVAYEFKRSQRRTIGLSVGPEGLSVRAPRWTPMAEVEALLHDKAAWVIDKLQRAHERAGALAQARIVWADGAELAFLGQRVRLQLDPAHGFVQVGAVLEPPASDAPERVATLRLGLAQSASEIQIRDAAQAWLMRQAKRVFAERLDHFAPQLGVRYTQMRLSSASTRWGSASANGTIRLNWRLIHLKMEMVDYVVVHELSHLRHMDHSPQFWAAVAGVLPDHRQRRQALRQSAIPLTE
ncbi:MAG: putative metal-dependent hydrolase [Hydrogenophaga sp.]|jgi:predicted metal-dependent hydrolase